MANSVSWGHRDMARAVPMRDCVDIVFNAAGIWVLQTQWSYCDDRWITQQMAMYGW